MACYCVHEKPDLILSYHHKKKDANPIKLSTTTCFCLKNKLIYVKPSILAITLLIFLFFLPLQCYIIGNDFGVGVQGAMYRYQMTGLGNSVIPITYEIEYVTSGIYTDYAALSVIFWVSGSFVLAITTIISLAFWDKLPYHIFNYILLGMSVSTIFFLISCFSRYGFFLSGPAGTCLPSGVLLMAILVIFAYYCKNTVFDYNSPSPKT